VSAPAPRPAVAELRVADDPATWSALGFVLADGVARVGTVGIRPVGAGAGEGIVGWSLRDGTIADLDGLPTTLVDEPAGPVVTHPNGAVSVDHVVVATPDRERTSAILDAAGLGLRRVRQHVAAPERGGRALEQGFHRAGKVIVEVVGEPGGSGAGPAAFWGLVCVTRDLDATGAALGALLGRPRDAVQPGRRIATVRREAGSTVPLAFISAE